MLKAILSSWCSGMIACLVVHWSWVRSLLRSSILVKYVIFIIFDWLKLLHKWNTSSQQGPRFAAFFQKFWHSTTLCLVSFILRTNFLKSIESWGLLSSDSFPEDISLAISRYGNEEKIRRFLFLFYSTFGKYLFWYTWRRFTRFFQKRKYF